VANDVHNQLVIYSSLGSNIVSNY